MARMEPQERDQRTGIVHLVMVGPLPPPTGGARVHFQGLLDCVGAIDGVEFEVVETPPARARKLRAVFALLKEVFQVLSLGRRADVITLHSTVTALLVRGGLVALVARLWKKPLVVYTFGGNLYREEYGRFGSGLVRRILSSVFVYLAQSREQVAHAKEDGVEQVEWFPNTRRRPRVDEDELNTDPVCRRFVFISHVKETKGIRELIEAGERFGEDAVIDVYGPFREGMTEAVFDGCRRVRYRGELAPGDVMAALRHYNALLLPTYHPGEGYPGIVIEAYMTGLPVICTRWRRLPEIVDERTGILVEPRDADALHAAMVRLMKDGALFARLRCGALERGKEFDMDVWAERFVQYCREAAATSLSKRMRRKRSAK